MTDQKNRTRIGPHLGRPRAAERRVISVVEIGYVRRSEVAVEGLVPGRLDALPVLLLQVFLRPPRSNPVSSLMHCSCGFRARLDLPRWQTLCEHNYAAEWDRLAARDGELSAEVVPKCDFELGAGLGEGEEDFAAVSPEIAAGAADSNGRHSPIHWCVYTHPAGAADRRRRLVQGGEVAQLKLNVDWVVVSACNTIAGDRPGAEVLSGLRARVLLFRRTRPAGLALGRWPRMQQRG